MNKGKSSSLPASISKIRMHLGMPENTEKLAVGPTSSRPGPMLFRVAATAVKFVTRSRSSIDRIRRENTNSRM